MYCCGGVFVYGGVGSGFGAYIGGPPPLTFAKPGPRWVAGGGVVSILRNLGRGGDSFFGKEIWYFVRTDDDDFLFESAKWPLWDDELGAKPVGS